MKILRSEHPKPQFKRDKWLNLNGEWLFEIDNSKSGIERGLFEDNNNFSRTINVPFCPESKLSGVENKDFMYGVWYKRRFTLPADFTYEKTILHFGAVDYICHAYINGKEVGMHKGGYVSFSFDITEYLVEGENTITVYAEDDTRDWMIPCGKQCRKFDSCGAEYTRTTGIWQTVWLENKPCGFIDSVRFYPDVKTGSLTIMAKLFGKGKLSAKAYYEDNLVGEATVNYAEGEQTLTLNLSEIHLWEVGNGRLYDVELTFNEDRVKSYFGLRNVCLADGKFFINGKSVFQRLILDQGFYPDGIYTAPDDADLKKDIQLSLDAGFNGARLHQKIFEERYLYYCDKMGYIVWGEYPDWGLDHTDPRNIYSMLPEWIEEVNRDFNHPAIIGWCPHNETADIDGKRQYDAATELIYNTTKSIDTTRPCIDSSGWFHVKTDIFDVHDYNQNPESFKANYDRLITENILSDEDNCHDERQHYNGEAVMVSEYGGIKWSSDNNAWGYGNGPVTEKEFVERFKGLTEALMENKRIFGICYTQLTDVEQEQNGLYTYDRTPKFNPDLFKEILGAKAAIED